MKRQISASICVALVVALTSSAAIALDFMEKENAKNGDKKALVSVAKAIYAAPPTGSAFLNDPWGAACLLKASADKGHKPAADLLKEKHGSMGNASAFLLKGLLDSCQEVNSCEPFAKDGDYKKAVVEYLGVCYNRGDADGPNAYKNGDGEFYLCLGPIVNYKAGLVDAITADALDIDPSTMADLYMSSDPTLQAKLAPAIQKESAGMVAKRYLSDKNFVQARFWYNKAGDQNGLAEVDKKEKAIAEFQEAKRKAESEAIAAQEQEKKKAIADDLSKKEAEIKADSERRAADQRVELERQAAQQRIELKKQEAEGQIAHEREVAQRKMAEEKAVAVAESEKKKTDALRSGEAQVANIDDAIKKYGSSDGLALLRQPPLTIQDGYWHLGGQIESVETNVPGQSGLVYMCSTNYGTFAFTAEKDLSYLRIKQGVNIVGRHIATEEGYSENQYGAQTKIYIPIFKAVEVIGD